HGDHLESLLKFSAGQWNTLVNIGSALCGLAGQDCVGTNTFTLFAINVGKHGACDSRAARLMRDGRRKAACKALARGPDGRPVWSYSGGVFVQGLQNRRQYEKNWCLTLAELG
ncbi:glycoside hydrolase family protein, partial [Variovorax sp. GB1P17]|uniref:glycoside hydrolase family protein n=1 Tax=Variovorax sp. GB1P17 TaxID=3443740 RepID=UPI003F467939